VNSSINTGKLHILSHTEDDQMGLLSHILRPMTARARMMKRRLSRMGMNGFLAISWSTC